MMGLGGLVVIVSSRLLIVLNFGRYSFRSLLIILDLRYLRSLVIILQLRDHSFGFVLIELDLRIRSFYLLLIILDLRTNSLDFLLIVLNFRDYSFLSVILLRINLSLDLWRKISIFLFRLLLFIVILLL